MDENQEKTVSPEVVSSVPETAHVVQYRNVSLLQLIFRNKLIVGVGLAAAFALSHYIDLSREQMQHFSSEDHYSSQINNLKTALQEVRSKSEGNPNSRSLLSGDELPPLKEIDI